MRHQLLLYLAAFTFFFGSLAGAQISQPQQCSALIKSTEPKLQMIRSGDLIGDGAQEYIAVQRMKLQPKHGIYISRLLIVRLERGHCSIILDARKDGPRNPLGYLGISYIDDGDDGSDFYGYKFEFGSDLREAGSEPRYKCVLFLDWLNPQHEPEGSGIVIGWSEKVGRFQEIDPSWDFFNPELPHPRHINTKNCGKCAKQRPAN